MIRYTIDEIRILAAIYQEKSLKPNIPESELAEYGEQFSYTNLMEYIIKEKENSEASLMEFIGAYDSVVYDAESWKMLRTFLFDEPIEKMPTYMNETGAYEWKSKVAQWRLNIGK